ncbi:hypothetical protein JQ575_18700 [Bradyrhizobium sp. JYMT SZCCT0428]|nr:hypothetical protein [Bradyrhizobium sp. JYMT SZCCT0428]MBR1152654.1 hypothetical protein [Bradyrhizobium sp. JYMT SZCCT0428]
MRFWYSPSKLKWPKDRPIRQPCLHRETHVDAGLGVSAAGQRPHLRRRIAAEHPHDAGGIRAHVQQAAAAELAVITKIGDRQRWDGELHIDVAERAILAKKIRQRLELG